MPAFSPSTHDIVVTTTDNLADAATVNARVVFSRLLGDLGVFQIAGQNTAPADRDVLWYHIDVKKFKRYDAVAGNWFDLTGNQLAMHLMRRALLGSVAEITLETGDLFYFWDVSAGELKKMTKDDLSANIVKDTLTALNGREFLIDTTAATVVVTLPAAPVDKERRIYVDRKGTFSALKHCRLARNGKTINLSATDLFLVVKDIGVELMYDAPTNDWQILRLFRSNVR